MKLLFRLFWSPLRQLEEVFISVAVAGSINDAFPLLP